MKKLFLLLILVAASWRIGLSQSVTANSGLEMKIGGDIQIDSRNFIDNPIAVKNNFLIRRVRVDFRGTYAKIFEFRIMPNFGLGRAEIDDAYVVLSFFPSLKLRAGKFKTPIGLERIQSPTNNFFIEPGLPNNLIPNRDIGFELGGSILKNIFNYSAGIYNGVIDGATEDADNDINKDFSGRIWLLPFASDKESFFNKLGFGIAGSAGKQSGSVSSTRLSVYRTAGQNTFFRFRDSVFADGNRTRLVPQAYLYSGRFGFLGEYVINNQKIKRNLSSAEITTGSWQANFSFLLTDDEASYNGVKPQSGFNPDSGEWGAFEIIFRYNSLTADDDVFPVFANPGNSAKRANEWAAGINWYLNDIFRISVNYANTVFKASGSSKALPDEKIVLTRIQAAF